MNQPKQAMRQWLYNADCEGQKAREWLRESTERGEVTPLDNLDDQDVQLYSCRLFEILDQPANVAFPMLRYVMWKDASGNCQRAVATLTMNGINVIACSSDTIRGRPDRLPANSSVINHGLLGSIKSSDGHYKYPPFDSWLLFTLLGKGVIKVEISIELCRYLYKKENIGLDDEDVVFWGFSQAK